MSKGDDRRPQIVSNAELSRRWCDAFGHKWSGDVCLSCGAAPSIADVVGDAK